MDALTICAVNYLPFANILGHSFLKFNPDSTFTILVIDSLKVDFDKDPNFNYLSPIDLEIKGSVFENMSFYYDVTELATALKPSALKKLFARGSKKILYLDPDIQVFSEFDDLELALESHSIVLTPHTLHPIPRDGLRPSELDILGSGTFNLGFIGLSESENARNLLDWWEERLRFDSISDPEEMLFTDQRWIDLVPSYFSFFSLRDYGYNVAYWNLHERNLSDINGEIFVNGTNLKFFHFSGYRPEKPWLLSKYVANKPRAVISKNAVLRKLCNEYSDLAFEKGWKDESTTTYGYENFDSGKRIPSSLRRLYREDCRAAFEKNLELLPPKDWQDWACSRTPETGNLSRILFSLWKSRPDLKRRFPDATGAEAKDLQYWARQHGVAEGVIDPDFISVGGLADDSFPSEFSNSKGINVSGYLRGESGLGQSSRLIYRAAEETGLQITALNSNRSKSRQNEEVSWSKIQKIFPVILTIVNADHFEFWINDINPETIKFSKIIGIWAWETEDFPKSSHKAFSYVDEIWAVSTYVKEAIQKHTKKPVLVFPTPIVRPDSIERLDRTLLGLTPNQEYNLFIFDYMSVFNRKNPLGVVEAHSRAFPFGDGPLLIIKSTNGESDPENRERLRYLVQGRQDILLLEDYLSRDQLTALINECLVYISLHRSEGYGLTMAEAMALGKPVIATGYSGNLDFMNTENSVLIPFTKVPVGANSFPYDPRSEWAEPDIKIAASYIEELSKNSELRQRLGIKAQESVIQFFTMSRASEFIENAFYRNYSWTRVAIKQLIYKLWPYNRQSLFKFIKSFIR